MSAPLHVTIDGLPVSGATRAALLADGIDGAVVYAREDDDPRVIVFGAGCQNKTQQDALRFCEVLRRWVTHVWIRGAPPPPPVRSGSRTAEALRLLANDPELTPRAAALQVGISPSAVYRALERAQERGVCHCCGRPL